MDENDNVAQNPMQPSIQGYRRFDQATSDAINEVKVLGNKIEAMLSETAMSDANQRYLALARTNLQQGAMWWIRALAKPDGLF